jgi:hypothetical protein
VELRRPTQCSQIAALLDCCPSLSVLQLIFPLLLSSSKSYHAGIEVATTIDSDERGGRAEIIHVRNERPALSSLHLDEQCLSLDITMLLLLLESHGTLSVCLSISLSMPSKRGVEAN